MADVCRVLGIGNPTNAKRTLKDGEVSLYSIKVLFGVHGQSRNVPANIVSESGLYKLIMRSDKPAARKFQDWVTREVLPTIRKTP